MREIPFIFSKTTVKFDGLGQFRFQGYKNGRNVTVLPLNVFEVGTPGVNRIKKCAVKFDVVDRW